MRIIAGQLGGRSFVSPRGHRSHPMSEKIRGALFNSLGDINGLAVLDAFSGSGALSFEAVSRGASQALAIESDNNAQRSIRESLKQLSLDHKVKLVAATAGAWLKTTSTEFDLVLLDPPYQALPKELLINLASRSRVGGTVVLSLPPDANVILTADFRLLATKDFGDSKLVFYKRIS